MLEQLTDIHEWEALLQKSIPDISFIADLPFTEEDWKRIEQYVTEVFQKNSSYRLKTVMKQTPSLLACYLVLRGVYSYQSGDYWSGISTGDQNILKPFFLDFVKHHSLDIVFIPDSLKYVTPILYQGYFPRSLIPDLISHIVLPLTKDLVDPESLYELRHWLEGHRSQFHLDERDDRSENSKNLEKTQIRKAPPTVDFCSLPKSNRCRINDIWNDVIQADAEIIRYQDLIVEKEEELKLFGSIGIDGGQNLTIDEFRFKIYQTMLDKTRPATDPR